VGAIEDSGEAERHSEMNPNNLEAKRRWRRLDCAKSGLFSPRESHSESCASDLIRPGLSFADGDYFESSFPASASLPASRKNEPKRVNPLTFAWPDETSALVGGR